MKTSIPTRTTLLGGAALALVAVIQLVPIIGFWFPTTGEPLSALRGVPGQVTAPLLLLVGCVILSFGYRGERDIVGSSVLGRVAFLLLGLAIVIQLLFFGITSLLNLFGAPATIWIGTAVGLLPIGAMAAAAVAVIRARVLVGFARWILLGVAAAEALQLALPAVQNASQDYNTVVVIYCAAVPPLLLLSAGVSFALTGRSAGIRQRLHTIDAAWRATT